jgi:hypothetical protein
LIINEGQKAAGELSPPSRSLTGPGQAPALGLRADGNGNFILSQTSFSRGGCQTLSGFWAAIAALEKPLGP